MRHTKSTTTTRTETIRIHPITAVAVVCGLVWIIPIVLEALTILIPICIGGALCLVILRGQRLSSNETYTTQEKPINNPKRTIEVIDLRKQHQLPRLPISEQLTLSKQLEKQRKQW